MKHRSKSPSSATSDRSRERMYSQDFPPRERELPAPPRELPPPRDYPPRDFQPGRELPPPRDRDFLSQRDLPPMHPPRDFPSQRELPPPHGGRERDFQRQRELPVPRDRDYAPQRELPPPREFQHPRDLPPHDARDRDFHAPRDREFQHPRELPPPRDGKDRDFSSRDPMVRDMPPKDFGSMRDETAGRDRDSLGDREMAHPPPHHFPQADMDNSEPGKMLHLKHTVRAFFLIDC